MNALTDSEEKIAEIVWANPGISSMETVRICNDRYGWKKSTVFTLLKRMTLKEMVILENSRLIMTVSKEDYDHAKTSKIVDDGFGGSLPGFLNAFLKDRRLSEEELEELETERLKEIFPEDLE